MIKEDFEKAKQLLDRANNILLTTHERTDGDDFGSISAIALHLESEGKKIVKAVTGGVPANLKFLPGNETAVEDIAERNFDLLVISGCSIKKRVGNENITNLKTPVLNIDHHPDNTQYGDVNVVDAEKSSVAELVYDFFRYCKWEITPDIATCLLTGIFTDTGSFMHSNTSASTLKAAADLMKRGARLDKIARHTYKGKTTETLKAWGRAINNTFYDEQKKIIYSVMTEDDMQNFGDLSGSVFEGFVETLNKVPEAKFAMFLKQDGEVIKGSLRSDPHKGINVGYIARLLGGGGHMWASGFSVLGKLEKDKAGKWKVVSN
jgi:phosphoesterase RecJ-like protein